MVNENMVPGTSEWKSTKAWYAHHASKIFEGGPFIKFCLEEFKAMCEQEKAEGFK